MPLTDVAPIEVSTEIAAPPATVWALVSDPRNYSRWSPQTWKTVVRGGEVKPGARMFNINRRRFLVWPTQAKIKVVEPEKKFAFRVAENWSVWSFELEPTATGTRLTQRREAPDGISDLSVRLTKMALGGVPAFTEELRTGMEQTLAKVKAEAER
ncbi:SRPBCC family protein [Nocardioides alcanivorans]|uniref:SRPBCC family protein n=1 Tax=Nocardioides alcanivorans TaxID=2897352 RepID=UPI001F45B6EE|nr:SRPBCC family protein [Nocardioides alcanivorans]